MCITGCNRGIGLGLVEHYLKSGDAVIAFCRNRDTASELTALQSLGQLHILTMDVNDNASIQAAVSQIENHPVDLLINNAGVGGGQQQSLEDIDPQQWLQVLQTNTLSPLFVTRALLPNLGLSQNPKVMIISSQLGAISYNNIGLYAYESSKAAVNKVVRGLAIDLKEQGITVCALHPGWVKTDMGGPNAEISVEVSVIGLANTIDNLNLSQTGSFWQWDGEEHPW